MERCQSNQRIETLEETLNETSTIETLSIKRSSIETSAIKGTKANAGGNVV